MLPIILAILCGAGILYYIIFRSMPPIILGITILCGAGLLFYIVRFIRDKLEDRESRKALSHMSLEELEAYRREIAELGHYTPLFPKSKVVTSHKIVCRRISGEVHTALVLIHEDETITVKCNGDCSDCPYGDVE